MSALSKTRIGLCLLLGLVFVIGLIIEVFRTPASSQAAEPSPATLQIMHQVPDIKSLPPLATMIPLTIEIKNSNDVNLKIRLVASRDGKLIDVAMPQGTLNANDVPVFQIEIPAPLAYMTYQFVARAPDDSLITTKRFIIRRPCIQRFRVNIPDEVGDGEFKKTMGELVAQAKHLERDTTNYETTLKLITELRELVDN